VAVKVNFNLTVYTPPALDQINWGLSIYTGPVLDGDNFALVVYSPPALDAVNFVLSGGVPYYGVLEYWTGAAWAKGLLKTYLAGSWQAKNLKRWDGTQWLLINSTKA
jgi:hypothetical protein